MADKKAMDAAEQARLQKRDDGEVRRPDQDLSGNQALRGRVFGSGHFGGQTRGHIDNMTSGKK